VSSYLHVLDGRLRVKVLSIRRSPVRADQLTRQLLALDGVDEVVANPTTGSVLIHFDSDRMGSRDLIQHLRRLGYLGRIAPRRGNVLMKRVALGLTEVAFQRMFAALLL
jgi:hypothetical protein